MRSTSRISKVYRALSSSLVVLTAGITFAGSLAAQESVQDTKQTKPKTTTEFLRLVRSESKEPVSLDTAITSYRAATENGVQVDLIGAVHIGEREYYEALNKRFDQYDVLLYELVAPENTVIPRGGKREGTNPVAFLQDSAKNMLGLQSQLELIDYTKSHFVRADMTPAQIAEKMAERGDTAFTVALSALADVMRQQNLAARESQGDTNRT